jgi:uncharacterized protein
VEEDKTYTAFAGELQIASGPLAVMLRDVKNWVDQSEYPMVLIFEDHTGQQVDFALDGPIEDVLSRALPERAPAGPGRPRLGVISREVTLLPRHWGWLEQQPNGASAALRRLVDQARAQEPDRQRARQAMDAAYRFMSAMGGNLPGFEEANRALFGGNREQLEAQIQEWPRDVRIHLLKMAANAFQEVPAGV